MWWPQFISCNHIPVVTLTRCVTSENHLFTQRLICKMGKCNNRIVVTIKWLRIYELSGSFPGTCKHIANTPYHYSDNSENNDYLAVSESENSRSHSCYRKCVLHCSCVDKFQDSWLSPTSKAQVGELAGVEVKGLNIRRKLCNYKIFIFINSILLEIL